MKKRLFTWLKILIIVYSVIGISLYYLQEKFLFHPEKYPAGHKYQFDMPFEEVNIAINATDTVNMIKFFPRDSIRKGVVLYFHGNKQNIERYARFVPDFTQHGYEVWMEDYPGFGKSTGERTEKKLYEEAMQVYTMAQSHYHPDSIILYGKSFGTGIASYVASQTDCKRLILETPYYSIPALFNSYAPIYPTTRMSTYKIPVNEYLQEVKYPISIFHGTDDGVIPYRCAAKLKKVLKPTDEFITIDEGTHHDLAGFPVYKRKLDSLLNH
jgi:alpha-beta hydrolase superfamily lysophospholipase